jgi:hypothetical protein
MLDTIKNIITLVAIIGTIGGTYFSHKYKEEAKTAHNNFNQSKQEWVDKKGRLVSELSEIKVSNSQLKNAAKKDSLELSEAERGLKKAANTIEELNLRLKDVKNYYEGEISVLNDSLRSAFEKDENGKIIGLKPIKTEHLAIDFVVESEDSILVSHEYKAKITVVNNRKPTKYTNNGNKRFILFRKIWPRWQYWATTRANDPNAEFNIEVHYNFDK